MFDIQNYGSFIIAVVVFQIIPGAGTITILNATARRGVGSGMKAVFGTLSGDFVYMLASVLGLAAILSAYPSILSSAQWIGAVYLCWIGWKLLRASVTDQPTDVALDQKNWVYFRQALTVSLTNPKVIMFFMAFFPLFLSNESTPVTLLTLMVHVTVISFIYQTGLVLFGNYVACRLSQWQYARLVATLMAAFLHRRSEELTDHLVDLLVETVHKMGKKAEKCIDNGLDDALQKAYSKMAKLYRIAKASVKTPQGVVAEVIFPEVPEKWLLTLMMGNKIPVGHVRGHHRT